jgi:hypothetical protein
MMILGMTKIHSKNGKVKCIDKMVLLCTSSGGEYIDEMKMVNY